MNIEILLKKPAIINFRSYLIWKHKYLLAFYEKKELEAFINSECWIANEKFIEDKSKYKRIGFIKYIVGREMQNLVRVHCSQKRFAFCESLDKNIEEELETEDYLYNKKENTSIYIDNCNLKLEFDNIIENANKNLNNEEQEILSLLIKGYSLIEIAKIIVNKNKENLNKWYKYNLRKIILPKIKNEINDLKFVLRDLCLN